MSNSDRPNRIEALKGYIDRALPFVLVVLVSMGAGALAVVSTDFFSPYKHESSEKNYYQTECYRLELTKPIFTTVEDQKSPEGRKAQAEWNKNYPPYCDLAAQFEASNSARSSSQYAAWTLILTFVGVVLLALTLKATRDTLQQANKATVAAEGTNETTLKVGEAQVRAYVGLENVNVGSPQIAPEKGTFFGHSLKSFILHFDARNTGQSPAIGLVVSATIEIIRTPTNEKWNLNESEVRIGTVVNLEENRILRFEPDLPTKMFTRSDFVLMITFNISFRDVFESTIIGTEQYVATAIGKKVSTTRVMSSFRVTRKEET